MLVDGDLAALEAFSNAGFSHMRRHACFFLTANLHSIDRCLS